MAGSSSKSLLKITLLSLLDICLTLVFLCGHGSAFSVSNLRRQFSQPYSFYHSTIDFFLLAFVRVALLSIGVAILVLKKDAGKVLNALSYLAACLSILFCCFSPTKLLALQDTGLAPTDPPTQLYWGDWAILGHNFVFSVLAYYLCSGLIEAAAKRDSNGSPAGYESLREGQEESSENGEEEPTPKVTVEIIVRLLHYVRNEWIWHVSGFTWLFIYSTTRIFVPYYTGQVIASVVSSSGDKYAALLDSVKLMIVISVISSVAGGFRGGSFEYAYARINRAVRSDLFSSLVRQDVAFYDTHKTGEVTSRLSADTQTMSDTVSLNINIFLRNTVQMAGSMIFMMALCWKLSLIPFVVVPIILMASKIFGVYYDLLSNKTQETVAHSNDVAEEVLSTMRTVRSFACEEVEADRFYNKLSDTLAVTKKKAVAYVGYLWVSELFQTLINIAVLWYGGHLVLTNQLNKDLLVSFLLYQMQLTDNIRQLGEVWTGLMQSVGASRKVFEYIDRQPDIETDGDHAPDHINGHIEFQNVHFAYPSRPDNPILKGLSFSVQPGQVIALVGPSGSGKSSCIALLEHFYRPTSGRILVDGVNIKDYEHHYIHNKIALVGQEPVLFARSVAENIAYGMEICTTTDVIEAAKLANAHSFIMDTHEQYDTNVGEKGSQMSGGQKQRIAIARALVRQPAILLLDEATSALDTESEHLVQEAIYNNLKGKSVILIAHRLSTVEKADKIVVISKGVVEQIGSHDELLNQDGIYRSLVQRQMIGGGNGAKSPAAASTPSIPRKQTVGSRPQSEAGASGMPGGTQTLSISPRSMAHSLLATSFTQSTSSLQSK